MRLTPVYAAVRLLSDLVASLPIKTYIKDPSTGTPHRWHGPTIFDRPAPETNVYDWIFECMCSLLLHGNAWGFILGRDGYGYPTGIQWMPPEMVTVIDDENVPFNPLRSRVFFYGRQMRRDEFFHIKAFALPGRTEAVSPLRAFAMTILNGMEAVRYGTDWFHAGGFPPGTFKNNEIEIDPTQAAEIRSNLNQSIRRREPLVYGRDWDYHPVTVPPNEAQFIQALQLNATQIAAVYGLPGDRIGGNRGDSLTYSNVEQSTLQIIEAMRPWLVKLETAFFDILPQNRYIRFNPDALLRTDLATRANIYKSWRDIGFASVDEMRELEDLPPLPGGIGKDNIPLDAIVGMSRSTRAVPNSILPQITLEARLALEYLEELQGITGATAPGVGPAPAGQGQGEKVPGPVKPQPGGPEALQPPDVGAYLEKLLTQARGRASADLQRAVRREAPEFIGPWIPDAREAVMHANGNGRH